MTPVARLPDRPSLHSVSTKVISFVFVSIFTTAALVSWQSIQSTHATLREQIDARLPLILERVSADLTTWTAAGRSELERLAASSVAPERASLEEWLARAPQFDAVAWVDGGRVRAQAGVPWTPPDPTKSDGLAAVAWQVGNTGGPEAIAHIPRPAKESSVLVARLSNEGLRRIVSAEARAVRGDLLLLDHAHRPVAHQRDADPADPRVDVASLAELAPGRVAEFTGRDGEHVLASAIAVPVLAASLVLEEPFDVAFAPVRAVMIRIFVIDLAIILFFSLLAYQITGRIMRPIRLLSEGAQRISEGQIDHEIPDPRTGDELGLLTRTFNEMMRKLRRNQLEIEEKNARLTRQYQELLDDKEVLAQLSITDGLTKLHNHRYFQDHLTREIKRVDRNHAPLSMLLMDLDDFKQLNDRMGHAAGDELLLRIAQVMSESIRESDLLARYGGEEFVVLAPATDLDGATALAEKIRMAVEGLVLLLDVGSRPTRATISIGVARYAGDRRAFFQSADRALYQAKADGKNCVVAAPVRGTAAESLDGG
jgi:diguanylate cyclase (GGDEF)-like protein